MSGSNKAGFKKPKTYHNQATIGTVNVGQPYYVASPTFGYEGRYKPVAGSVSSIVDCDKVTGKLGKEVSSTGSLWATFTEKPVQVGKFNRGSLTDTGVIHSTYTDRLAFLTEESAIHYAKTGKILKPKGTNMKQKLINKLSKYAIDLSGDRQKLKQFIESKGWPIWQGTNIFTVSSGLFLFAYFDGDDFSGTCNNTKNLTPISINDFIYKFSSKCERKILELEAKLAKRPEPDEGKDWRTAFAEHRRVFSNHVRYSCANTILFEETWMCTTPRILMSYVLQFKEGGFWLEEGTLYFVTAGVDSDPKATYQHAKEFIANY